MRDNYGWPEQDDNRGKIQNNNPLQRLRLLLVILVVLVVLFAGGFFYLLATRSQPGSSPTRTSTSGGSGSNATSQPAATQPPTSSPTQVPTPTPTPRPGPGTVLCQANSNWSGWNGTKDWKVSNGMLLDDGTSNTPGGSITAPCQLTVPDYAVEVTMQVVNFQSCCTDNVGMILRGSSTGGYDVGLEIDSNHLAKIATDYTSVNPIASAHFDPGLSVHTYRAEVKGNTIKFFIDGGLLVSATDNQFLDPGQVGLYSSFVQVEVTSFKVTAL